MFRVAVVGYGPWAQNILRTLRQDPSFELLAMITRQKVSKEFLSEKTQVFDQASSLLDMDLDGIILSTPPETHLPLLKLLSQRHRFFFVEKPFCLSLNELKENQEWLRKLSLFVDYIQLFSTGFQNLKKQIQGQTILSVRFEAGNQGPFRSYSPLWDYGPHDLSMLLTLIPHFTPVDIEKNFQQSHFKGAIKGTYKVNWTDPLGRSASHLMSNELQQKTRFIEVKTDKGVFIYDDLKSPAYPGPRPLEKALTEFQRPSPDSLSAWDFDFTLRITELLSILEPSALDLSQHASKAPDFSSENR